MLAAAPLGRDVARGLRRLPVALVVLLAAGGCSSAGPPASRAARAALARDLASRRPLGRGPAFVLPARPRAVTAGRPLAGLPCTAPTGRAYGVHVELFASERVLLLPAGVGIGGPAAVRGAYVRGGRCVYPLRTHEPTGLVEVAPGPPPRLAALFALWGQPLRRDRLASFRGPVLAYVDGVRWPGSPAAIPLRPHAQVTLEVQGAVPPHVAYRFPPGL